MRISDWSSDVCSSDLCVEVCPVDCFKQGRHFLVIDPLQCIDCGVCIPVCPVNAIYPSEQIPPDQQDFIALNASLANDPAWGTILFKQEIGRASCRERVCQYV